MSLLFKYQCAEYPEQQYICSWGKKKIQKKLVSSGGKHYGFSSLTELTQSQTVKVSSSILIAYILRECSFYTTSICNEEVQSNFEGHLPPLYAFSHLLWHHP